jgi:hypothetical protein
VRTSNQKRSEALARIERLLSGINYVVWLNLYGPGDSESGLADALKSLISKDCELSGVVACTPEQAVSQIIDRILYRGNSASGPLQPESKAVEITRLMNTVFSSINIHDADMVVEFGFKNGHPAYPVFWDFAYDIHVAGKRWIFAGSSSD